MYKKMMPGLFIALFAVSAFASSPVFEEVDADKNGSFSQNETSAAGVSDESSVHQMSTRVSS